MQEPDSALRLWRQVAVVAGQVLSVFLAPVKGYVRLADSGLIGKIFTGNKGNANAAGDGKMFAAAQGFEEGADARGQGVTWGEYPPETPGTRRRPCGPQCPGCGRWTGAVMLCFINASLLMSATFSRFRNQKSGGPFDVLYYLSLLA